MKFRAMILSLLLCTSALADSDHSSGDVTCTVGGSPVAVSEVCEASAAAICGDAIASCQSGDLFLAVAVTKQACVQANDNASNATADCQSAAQSCEVNVECPACPAPEPCPDVEIGTQVIRCKKIVERPDGRIIRKGCLVTTGAY